MWNFRFLGMDILENGMFLVSVKFLEFFMNQKLLDYNTLMLALVRCLIETHQCFGIRSDDYVHL